MCDYSLQHIASRPAQVGDKLVSSEFIGTISHGFAPVDDGGKAVCVLPGTEIAFEQPVKVHDRASRMVFNSAVLETGQTLARFRQVNKEIDRTHHDALELADGRIVLLNDLVPGQRATILQLPAAPKTEAEADEQKRLAIVA